MAKRKIVRIDEELCNGCGLCVTPCAEGAIQIVNGKAKVMREELCDGAGVCLAVCPSGALTIEEREAKAFDEAAAEENLRRLGRTAEPTCFSCGNTDRRAALFNVRIDGETRWVCAKCIPGLIHG